MSDMRHMEFIDAVRKSDVDTLRKKEATYMGSWKRAGGRSAWFMLRRNMDRLLTMMAPPSEPHRDSLEHLEHWCNEIRRGSNDRANDIVRGERADVIMWLLALSRAEDIFRMIEVAPGGEDGTVLACVRDLRCYLTLVEAEMMARGVVKGPEVKVKTDGVPPRMVPRMPEPEDARLHGIVAENCTARTITPGIEVRASNYPVTVERDEPFPDGVNAAMVEAFYTKHQTFYVLDPAIQSHNIPRGLAPFYFWGGNDLWVININTVPPDVRSYFPSLVDGINLREWEQLEPWQRELYHFNDQDQKYNLKNLAWANKED